MILGKYLADENYLFHGSYQSDIEVFEPRQAYSFDKPDGEPSIFASSKLDPAIFMALFGSRKMGGWEQKTMIASGSMLTGVIMKKLSRMTLKVMCMCSQKINSSI